MQSRAYSTIHWAADDTEESILGADWHQLAIGHLRNSLARVARATTLPWHIGYQLTLVAWHSDGARWRPIPDIMVHPFAGPELRTEMDAHCDGVPALIVEVASRSTWHIDVEMDPTARDGAKAYEYLALGVAEYLVFDPEDKYLPGQVCAWRQSGRHITTWTPDQEGRYHSTELGIAFVPEGLFLRVIDREGQPVPFNDEQGDTIVTLGRRVRAEAAGRRMAHLRAQQEATRATQEMARRQEAEAELERLRAELERLRSKGGATSSS